MAAEVSGQMKGGLITRDLLGGCFGIESKELDLDLHVPSGWEKRLDLKSGKVFIQRCNPSNSTSDESNSIPQSPLSSSITMSSPSKPTLNLLEDKSIGGLNLEMNPFPSSYTSVCTLEKVKSALDRAERTSTLSSSSSSSSSKKRRIFSSSSSSMSNSSSVKQGDDEDDRLLSREQVDLNGLVVTACPNCLLYVLVSKRHPKCPQCNLFIELPSVTKKPKIDLNMPI